MKSIAYMLAFYFLLGSLFPGTDFSQLIRLAHLLEHFELHQQHAAQRDQSLSLAAFLLDHFWNPDRHEPGDAGHHHQDLPLQSVQNFPLVLPEHHDIWRALELPSQHAAAQFSDDETCLPTGYCGAVFRPPVAS
jgi:hypothetical protein